MSLLKVFSRLILLVVFLASPFNPTEAAQAPASIQKLELVASMAPTSAADMQVSQSDSPDPVLVGSTMTYTVVVTNAGPMTATGVILVDNYPGFAVLHGVSFSRQGVPCGGSPTVCPIGQMAPGEVLTAELFMTATKFAVPSMSSVVSVNGVELDPDMTNNSSTETTTVIGPVTATPTATSTPMPVPMKVYLPLIVRGQEIVQQTPTPTPMATFTRPPFPTDPTSTPTPRPTFTPPPTPQRPGK